MKLKRSLIPNVFTILNMFSGFLAILQILQGHYITAVILIIAAMIFDALDGMVARWLQQQSDFGIEFDSLADIISFCVTPALLINVLFMADLGFIGAIISFFPLLFGGVRLARFNLTASPQKKEYFTGLPVPAMAATIGAYLWFNKVVFGNYGDPKTVLPLVIVLSFMMVSNIRFSSIHRLHFRNGIWNAIRSGLMVVCAILIIFFGGYVLFPILGFYIVTHILIWIVGYDEPRVHFSIRRKGR
jgi:CDP-diacylglycerol--serine O-phosphatidyltransferase